MSVIYKYKSISTMQKLEYLIDSLKNHYLYFSKPSELNDNFDCFMPVSFDGTNEDKQDFCDRYNRKNNENLTVEIINEKLKNNEFCESFYDDSYREFLDHFHICSFSKDNLNESMWAKYADELKGICIGYKAIGLEQDSELLLEYKPLNIENIAFIGRKYKENLNLLTIREMEYCNKSNLKYQIFHRNQGKQIFNICLQKKECWQTENEMRGVFMNLYPEVLPNLKITYPDETLNSIYFGQDVSSNIIDCIKSIVRDNYKNYKDIKFYIVKPDYYQYRLVPYEI